MPHGYVCVRTCVHVCVYVVLYVSNCRTDQYPVGIQSLHLPNGQASNIEVFSKISCESYTDIVAPLALCVSCSVCVVV